MAEPSPDSKRIERVILACVQCRGRHVKCDATQPVCNRCKRDGKECTYQKSRRGGLDKAALARRRLRLEQEARNAQRQGLPHSSTECEHISTTDFSSPEHQLLSRASSSSGFATDALQVSDAQFSMHSSLAFQVSNNRLLELYYQTFWPSFPIVLPLNHLQSRLMNFNHGMDALLPVLYWIGSLHAPWTASDPYSELALNALNSVHLPRTPFNVQALMLFAIAQNHMDMRDEARKKLNLAVAICLELRMNQRGFAQAYGEGSPVLEEAWRRTYYMLYVAEQHFAVTTNTPIYTLLSVPNSVDLPCDDEFFETGNIPPIATWQEYENREFAEVEIVYSSIVYLYDMAKVVAHVMQMFLETGTFGEHIIDSCDAKVAIWSSLLPACKKDPLTRNGEVDEVMYMAHLVAAITISTLHRPFSSLIYSTEEMTTQSFLSPTPFVVPPKVGRSAHTARTLKAVEMHTKLLAIPCAIERHNVFGLCITAQLAAVQVSACTHLLEDHALSIARDRVRLSIGFLNAMGSIWTLGKKMAKEVKAIARANLSGVPSHNVIEAAPQAEIEITRDDLVWPVDPSAQIDIYSGIVLPADWDTPNMGFPDYASSSSSSLT